MNPALQVKLNELEEYADYECWYLVKQPTKFESICYFQKLSCVESSGFLRIDKNANVIL